MARASSDIVRFVLRGIDLIAGTSNPICPVVARNFVILGVDIVFTVTTGTMSGGGSFSIVAGGGTVATGAVLPTTGTAARFSVTPAQWLLNQPPSEGTAGVYLTVVTPPTGSGGLNILGTVNVWGYFA